MGSTKVRRTTSQMNSSSSTSKILYGGMRMVVVIGFLPFVSIISGSR
jgi:hypothetical protein